MEKKYRYIDLTYLKEVSKDTEFLKKILSVFDKEYTDLLKELSLYLEQEDTIKIKDSIHKAKSSVLMTTIPEGRDILLELENLVKKEAALSAQKTSMKSFTKLCNLAMKEIRDAAKNL